MPSDFVILASNIDDFFSDPSTRFRFLEWQIRAERRRRRRRKLVEFPKSKSFKELLDWGIAEEREFAWFCSGSVDFTKKSHVVKSKEHLGVKFRYSVGMSRPAFSFLRLSRVFFISCVFSLFLDTSFPFGGRRPTEAFLLKFLFYRFLDRHVRFVVAHGFF